MAIFSWRILTCGPNAPKQHHHPTVSPSGRCPWCALASCFFSSPARASVYVILSGMDFFENLTIILSWYAVLLDTTASLSNHATNLVSILSPCV